MNLKHNLPFEKGHLVEAKSFVSGFRGSWFRCKVREISWKKGSIGCILEYIDFPDEKLKWTKLYQKPPINKTKGRMKDIRGELMVRPCYPPVYREDEINDSRNILEVSVTIANDWTVGDLVDWWADAIYWCGTVIQLLDGDKAKIKLPDPPIGEGQTYDVHFKDLRPTLFWSPEKGWSVSTNQVDRNRPCCRLILPTTQGEQTTLRGQNDAKMSTSEFKASLSSRSSSSSLPLPHKSEHYPPNPSQNQKLDKCDSVESCHGEHASNGFTDCVTVKPLHSDSIASSLDRATSDNVLKANDSKEIKDGGNCKRAKISGEVNCSIGSSDTIEASILELEELACKVRWIKMVLDNGSPMLDTRPSWKFVENRATAAPKI
ncbi:unnamed protein product [Rhodiola kirilowii]